MSVQPGKLGEKWTTPVSAMISPGAPSPIHISLLMAFGFRLSAVSTDG